MFTYLQSKHLCNVDIVIIVPVYLKNSLPYQVHCNTPLKYSVALLWISLDFTEEVKKRLNSLCPNPFNSDVLFLWTLGHCPSNRAPFLQSNRDGWFISQRYLNAR